MVSTFSTNLRVEPFIFKRKGLRMTKLIVIRRPLASLLEWFNPFRVGISFCSLIPWVAPMVIQGLIPDTSGRHFRINNLFELVSRLIIHHDIEQSPLAFFHCDRLDISISIKNTGEKTAFLHCENRIPTGT